MRDAALIGCRDSLLVGIFAGAIGVGYCIYGKRETKVVPMVAGAMLCVYPYFVDNLLWLILVGVVLIAIPFLIDY